MRGSAAKLSILAVVAALALAAPGTAAEDEKDSDSLALRGSAEAGACLPAGEDTPCADDGGGKDSGKEGGKAANRGGKADRAGGDDLFAPLGVRAGAFRVFPAVEARIGHSDNVDQRYVSRQSGAYTRLIPEVEIRSDWSRHALIARGGLVYRRALEGADGETTDLDAELAGRVDIRNDTSADLRLSYQRAPQSRDDPNVPAGATRLPDVADLRGEGSLTREIGRLGITLRGAVETTDYEDDDLSATARRSYRTEEAGLRTSLDLGADTAVFVETGINRRRYDHPVGADGVRRGSRGYDVVAGLAFRPSGVLSGEIAAGYQRQRPDAPEFADISGLTYRGSLVWEPTALTTISFDGALTPEESVGDPAVSGARVHSADLTIAHAFRRHLLGTATLGYTQTDYIGSPRRDTSHRLGAGLEYLLRRDVILLAEAGHERHDSTLPGHQYEETWIELGVRVQR